MPENESERNLPAFMSRHKSDVTTVVVKPAQPAESVTVTKDEVKRVMTAMNASGLMIVLRKDGDSPSDITIYDNLGFQDCSE